MTQRVIFLNLSGLTVYRLETAHSCKTRAVPRVCNQGESYSFLPSEDLKLSTMTKTLIALSTLTRNGFWLFIFNR